MQKPALRKWGENAYKVKDNSARLLKYISRPDSEKFNKTKSFHYENIFIESKTDKDGVAKKSENLRGKKFT